MTTTEMVGYTGLILLFLFPAVLFISGAFGSALICMAVGFTMICVAAMMQSTDCTQSICPDAMVPRMVRRAGCICVIIPKAHR